MRSWLNGYGAEDNKLAVDYRGENFINSAFSAAEQAAIFSSEVKNADNIEYGTDGGNDTVDKIFLLSEAEVRNGGLAEEGKRSVSGISSSSIYAKAMGILTDYDAASYWWLRSPGGKLDSTYYPDDSRAMYVSPYGNVITGGQMVGITNLSGVRPALMLELSSSSLYTYAGTVSFGETVQGDKEPGNTGNSNGSGGAGSSSGGSNGGENGNGQTVKQFTDTASKAVYDVTAANAAGGTVTYRTSKNKKAAALTIPGQVKVSGKTYRVTKIAANAFKNCSKLKKVTIGSNITEIGKNAFSGCRKLKTITVKSKVLKKVGGKAFKGIHKKAKIKVPKAKLKAYKKLFKGKGQAKSVKITK